MTYFNEIDPFAAAWLGNLYPTATVDQRSIADVRPDDVSGFTRCHFFAGIAGWEYALALAGWPADRPVWTGSCPCQPFSNAGKRRGGDDDRHLWPTWYRLIRECRPPVIFGEQVPGAIAHGWLDAVFTDLEAEGYACGAVVLGACGVGAPHRRQRLYWVADADAGRRGEGRERGGLLGEISRDGQDQSLPAQERSTTCGLADTQDTERRGAIGAANAGRWVTQIGGSGGLDGWLADPNDTGGAARVAIGIGDQARSEHALQSGAWSAVEWVTCRDGKARPTQPGIHPLAYGVPGRVGRLRAYGNAIVPQVAAEFVRAFMETET